MIRKEKKMVKITGTLGSMTFRSHMAAWEFRTKIASWAGFRGRPPILREEAVDYHLAYCAGGAPAVWALESEIMARERAEEMAEMHRAMMAETERKFRYAMASLADPRSDEYRSHYDSWHPGYKWGK